MDVGTGATLTFHLLLPSPEENFTGFYPICLYERLVVLDSNTIASASSSSACKPPISSTTAATLKAIFKPSFVFGASSHSNMPPISSSFLPKLHRTSFSTSNSIDKPRHNRMMREQDQYMPIVNVIIIMPWILLPHAKISDQAKETIQDCVSDYICSITSEANQRCQQEQCKTVTADDLLWAMRSSALTTTWALSLYLQCYRKGDGGSGGGH
ncbi:hypothetical protein K1719_029157 [Acacia pycnantha]|nr:hypothetical protein K1719_029157 [Acacia pycnantha]